MHALLQHGVLSTEIEGLISRSAHLGINRETLQAFLKDETWVFPHAKAQKQRGLHRIFDVHRASEKEPDKLRCTCTELLGAYGRLRFRLKLREMPASSATCSLDPDSYRFPVSATWPQKLGSAPAAAKRSATCCQRRRSHAAAD